MKKSFKFVGSVLALVIVTIAFQSCTSTVKQGCPERIQTVMPAIFN